MSTVTLIIGRVASGKTTYASRLNAVLLSMDELTEGVLGDFMNIGNRAFIEDAAKEYLFRTARRILAQGADAVLDFGFFTRAERERARAVFAGFDTRFLYINTPSAECERRLTRRNADLSAPGRVNRLISPEKFKVIDSRFQEPLPDEYDLVIDWRE